MRLTSASLLITLFFLFLWQPVGAGATEQDGRANFTIVENERDKNGSRLFSVQADSTEITQLLKALFLKAGDEFSIDQDVAGPVDLKVKNATLEQIFQRVIESAYPPVRIKKDGKFYRVSRAYDLERAALEIRERMRGRNGFGSPMGELSNRPGGGLAPLPNGYQTPSSIPSNRYVTLEVPKTRPISMVEALARISEQARFPIMLDKRVPRELSFWGNITQASLPLVLQAIADTSDLKLIADGTQAILVPTDQFTVLLRDVVLRQYSHTPCRKCGQRLPVTANYCPNCGQITARGAQNPAGLGSGRPGYGGNRRNK